jgi:hypothetical protein
MKKLCLCLFALSVLFTARSAFAGMILSFDSAEQSWVGQGESHTVSPEDGYLFSVEQHSWDKSLSFLIASLNSPFGPDWNPSSGQQYYYWSLDLIAPFDQVLAVGFYDNAARYPFQNDNQPGLTFSGNHRGNNQNSGFFEVRDIAFNSWGGLKSIAVDFTQYDETHTEWWIRGQLRYNSDLPLGAASVPEPSALQLFALAVFALILKKKSRIST